MLVGVSRAWRECVDLVFQRPFLCAGVLQLDGTQSICRGVDSVMRRSIVPDKRAYRRVGLARGNLPVLRAGSKGRCNTSLGRLTHQSFSEVPISRAVLNST